MNKLLIGSVALAAIAAGPAMAADMPVKAPAPVISYYDWSGVYIGASIGGVWGDHHRFYPAGPIFPAGDFTWSFNDTVWDVHLGAQQQWGWFVLGVEAGYSAGFKEMNSASPSLPASLGFIPNLSAYNKITNLFTVGPRVGVAFDRWMIYGTGGWATASLKGQYVTTVPGVQVFPLNHGQSWNTGWFAGGGVEYMIYKGPLVDAIAGVEYQHFDVSDLKNQFTISPDPLSLSFQGSARGDIVRARLTIKTQGWRFIAP